MYPRREKGIALAIVLGFVLLLAIAAASFMLTSLSEIKMVRRQNDSTRAFYLAEAGVESAVTAIKALYALGSIPTDSELRAISPPDLSGFGSEIEDYFEFTNDYQVEPGIPYFDTIQFGIYEGLQGEIRPITITSHVRGTTFNLVRGVVQTVEVQFIPMFQFGVFYEEDLEILPGVNMTFIGRVHTNGNLYVGAGSAVWFDAYTTAAGDIFHDRKDDPGNVGNGPVRFKDAEGVYQEMFQAGVWLDSRREEWLTESQTRWSGMVKSQDHDVSELRLPMPVADEPHDIIERANPEDSPELAKEKYYNKAGLKIVDGVATNKNGFPVTLEEGILTARSMYDYREGETITITEIDIGALRESGQSPSNGILYASETGSDKAIRLANGSALPSGGLTVASDNPIYIQGDYNTVNKKPASVLTDAINILSNNWDDANSTEPLPHRIAESTTVNCAFVTGNTETEVGSYNGGLENLMRFLEKWGGKTLTYSGSLVDLWYSEQATGAWYYGDPYYTAPIRDWSYDTAFSDPANAPPGIPSVYVVEKGLWRHE